MSHRLDWRLGLVPAALLVVVLAGCGAGAKHQAEDRTATIPPMSESQLVTARPDGPDVYEHPNAAADAYTFVTPLGGNRYRLEVTNTSSRGFINDFTWFPGPGLEILAVTGTRLEHGKGPAACRLVDGKIACDLSLRPPRCTCRGDGGTVAIEFRARTHRAANGANPTFGGDLYVRSETLVPYFIPSTPGQKPSELADLPICAAGQESTAAKPCQAGR